MDGSSAPATAEEASILLVDFERVEIMLRNASTGRCCTYFGKPPPPGKRIRETAGNSKRRIGYEFVK